MLKKTITYEDFNGNTLTEDFYFNLSKAELTEKQLATPGGYAELLQSIVDSQDAPQIMKVFKELILDSYGVKSEDGKHFKKNQELRDSFADTEAYSVLFMELASDSDAAANFVNGILPKDLANQADIKKLQQQIQ